MNEHYLSRRQAIYAGGLVAAGSGFAGAYAASNTSGITRISPTVAANTGMEGEVFAEYEADDGVPSEFVLTMESIDISWSNMPDRIDGLHLALYVVGPGGRYLVCWADPDVYAIGDDQRGMAEDDAITDYPGKGTLEGALFDDDDHDPSAYAVDTPGGQETFDIDFEFDADFYFRDEAIDPFHWSTSFTSRLRVIHTGESDTTENGDDEDKPDDETDDTVSDPEVSVGLTISRV